MKKEMTLAGTWATYERKVVPESASDEQRRAMRDCFYTGASTVLDILRMHMSPSDEITPEDDALMDGLDDELAAFERELTERQLAAGKPGLA